MQQLTPFVSFPFASFLPFPCPLLSHILLSILSTIPLLVSLYIQITNDTERERYIRETHYLREMKEVWFLTWNCSYRPVSKMVPSKSNITAKILVFGLQDSQQLIFKLKKCVCVYVCEREREREREGQNVCGKWNEEVTYIKH